MPVEPQRWNFGVLPFTSTGQLTPLIILAQSLRDRGHSVTFFEKRKIESRVRQAGLGFCAIGENEASFRNSEDSATYTGPQSEFSRLEANLNRILHDLDAYLRSSPTALRQAGVNVLLINEVALTGPTIAQLLHLPYFIYSTSVPHNLGWKAFPPFSGYRYSPSFLSWLQAAIFEVSALRMRGPIRKWLDAYRRKLGLGPVRALLQALPPLAQITQLPACLDYPRTSLPRNFHYTGPFVSRATRPAVPFPWHRIDGRQMIYASLGTTRNIRPEVFRMIAEACRNIDAQVVISLGGRLDPEMFTDLPGNPLVTRYAPQLELLKRASIVITHGGSNTVFEALMEGKPMVAIPLALDQPAVAARLARLGIAEVLPVMRLSSRTIRKAVLRLLHDPRYHEAALRMQSKIRSLQGLERAVDIIERALETQAALQADTANLGERSAEIRRDAAIRLPGPR
jgi:zeaxanthin glucosyltransferase